ncbi:alpha/beta hydrolase [Paenibacillus borealis]|uniref:Alpha/beta hydrolase n=1 Tax=Paenibacillus borealis TaxID=160799 RepID=A0ABX3HC46_PAEBO|nr:alpha/beta hydrolase [Paenibacillus borealis]OMD46617.1 alpha/beta hydrolase [Paenibacillus borealis]
MAGIPRIERGLRCFISVICFPLTMIQMLCTQRDVSRYKPQGQLVGMDKGYLHAQLTGQGAHTIVLEAGMGGCSLDWTLVQPEISGFAKVISYDRAGLGWSGKPLEEATCRNYAVKLRDLLQALDCEPPYLLVGHSYGGMIVRSFAVEYPDEVDGLLLVDAVHESRYLAAEMSGLRHKQWRANLALYRLGYLLSPTGLLRLLGRHVGTRRLPAPVQRITRALGYRNNACKTVYAEMLFAEESARQLSISPPLSLELPITVLSAGMQNDEWKRGQERLSQLTPKTKHILVENSWHSIQIHRPDMVIAAIKDMMTS